MLKVHEDTAGSILSAPHAPAGGTLSTRHWHVMAGSDHPGKMGSTAGTTS